MADPKVGEDGLVFEDRPLSTSVLQAIPTEVGLWKTSAVYSCLEANEDYIVIGSKQGLVWVIDLESSKLIREYSDFRGSVVSVLRLSPTRDLLAYGTSDGHVRVEKITRPMNNKWRLQEKSKQAVRALEWRGDELFCGFGMGRVICMRLSIHDGTMSPLTFPESYGSAVTQLSCRGNSLLVSTQERTWVVDTETHKLEQVGRKDRKAGSYGGCLVAGGQTAYVARPGLRLWAADSSGKVSRTIVYKEALSTQHLPRVPLHSWSSLVPSFNRAWQFAAVHPWVGEHFIVTLSETTLFILDPLHGLIVGVLALGHTITDIAITRSFIYILCNDLKKPVCRISVKQSFLRALKKALPLSEEDLPKSKTSVPQTPTEAVSTPADSTHTVTTVNVSKEDKTEIDREKTPDMEAVSVQTASTSTSIAEANKTEYGIATQSESVPTSAPESFPSTDPVIADEKETAVTQSHLTATTNDTPTQSLNTGFDCKPIDMPATVDSVLTQSNIAAVSDDVPISVTAAASSSLCENVESEVTETVSQDKVDLEVSPETDLSHTNRGTQPIASGMAQSDECLNEATVAGEEQPVSLSEATDTPIPSHGSSVEQSGGEVATTDVLESDTTECEQLDSAIDMPVDQALKPGISTNSVANTRMSDSSTSVQTGQVKTEPSLQEALQTVKAEMKELFKPIKLDKFSNIFKSNNSSGPSRLRVLASRNRKAESEEPKPDPDMDIHIEERKSTPDPQPTGQREDATNQEQAKKPDLKDILKLGRIGNLLLKDVSGGTTTPVTTPIIITPAPLDQEEQERRLRMSQSKAEAEDDVVVMKKDKKKKKKRKQKKISSATSSVSVSLEKLTELEENEDSPAFSASATPLSESPSAAPFTLTEEQRKILELLKLERNGDTKSVEQPVLESLPEVLPEVEKKESEAKPQMMMPRTGLLAEDIEQFNLEQEVPKLDNKEPVSCLEQEQETLWQEQDSVLQEHSVLYTDTPLEQETLENNQQEKILVAPPQNTTSIKGTDNLTLQEQTTPSADSPEQREYSADIPLFEDLDSPSSDPLFSDEPNAATASQPHRLSPMLADSQARSHDLNVSTTLDLSDNPLYHNSDNDHDQRGHGNFEVVSKPVHLDVTSSRLRNTAPSKLKSSLLQPGDFDPLQSDDSHEGYFGGEPSDKLVDTTPVILRPRTLLNSPDMRKRARINHPSPIVSSPQSGYQLPRETREISAEVSDSEDEDNLNDSQVAPDFYQLCGSLVRHSNQKKEAKASGIVEQKSLWDTSEFQRENVVESDEEKGDEGPTSNADIWVPIPHPGRSQIQCVCLSDTLLWIVDGRKNVFCTTTASKGKDWQLIKKPMSQVCSSQSGKIVWGVHHWNAYVRLGIGLNPAGSYWKNTTKGTFMSRKIKYLSVSENSVWGVTTDNRTIFRKGVNEGNPEGHIWQEVSGEAFSHISCCKNIVWAHTSLGKVFIREGVTRSMPSGNRWSECKCPKLIASCLTNSGVVWGINSEGSIGFRCGVTTAKPSGKGPWWEVKINALMHPSSPYNSLWQVMGAEGSQLLTSVTNMLPHIHIHQSKPLVLSASSKSGVIILQDSNRLHACWRTATGYHYRPASKNGLFPITVWSNMAAGNTGLWLVRDDGDLYCLTPTDKLRRIECPSVIQHVAASPNCMWIVADNLVWSRQGLSPEVPEGLSFDYIEMSPQMHERKIKHIACGKTAVWAVDNTGVPHFRFGVHSREPGTGMSPAWIPVEDIPNPLSQIAVCPDNWLVWARDEKYNCYVRTGVTHDFPIGRKWEVVPSEQIKELCLTNEYVYALTPSGDFLCRYGISEGNVQGNYWRRMPGKYEHLTTGKFGELWTLDSKGQVWKQEWKIQAVSHDPKAGQDDFETSMIVDQEWEVV